MPREGVSGLGSQGEEDAASGRFYERGFSPRWVFFSPLFRRTKENRVAVPFSVQADFVTHVLPSVT